MFKEASGKFEPKVYENLFRSIMTFNNWYNKNTHTN